MKREHSRKPDELYDIIEACCPGPYLELFARGSRKGWRSWGNQAQEYAPTWPTYSNHSRAEQKLPPPVAEKKVIDKPAAKKRKTKISPERDARLL
jgi:MT-A70